jgi:pyridinium-3,5-biscarboxylic acid mononucleotide sulfurtransferase
MTDLSESTETANEKQAQLEAILCGLGRVVVAYSGGVDSSYLLATAVDALGSDNVLAVTVASELTPEREVSLAQEMAARLGARHQLLSLQALAVPDIAANPPDRCYFCKREVLRRIAAIAAAQGFVHLVHGANRDDQGDYRPGTRAAAELGARAPLEEAGLTKAEIRELSRRRGLSTWDRPSQACLASRVPYHTPLTAEALRRIQAAEDYLHDSLGLQALRVRDHFPVARIEVPPADWPLLLADETRSALVAELRCLGYRYVALDLAGLRSGSMNDLLGKG